MENILIAIITVLVMMLIAMLLLPRTWSESGQIEKKKSGSGKFKETDADRKRAKIEDIERQNFFSYDGDKQPEIDVDSYGEG